MYMEYKPNITKSTFTQKQFVVHPVLYGDFLVMEKVLGSQSPLT